MTPRITSADLAEHQRRQLAPKPTATPASGDTATITLPLPAKSLSPNARVCRQALARSKAIHRERARWVTYDALPNPGSEPPRWKSASIQATFYHAQIRRRDQMNLIGSLKAYEDGIVDSGLLYDDEGVTWLPPIKCISRDNPRLVLVITRQEAPDD